MCGKEGIESLRFALKAYRPHTGRPGRKKVGGRAFPYGISGEKNRQQKMQGNGTVELGAHARIRTGDLFLTKWSSIPGELALILARPVEFGGDHLTQSGVLLSLS